PLIIGIAAAVLAVIILLSILIPVLVVRRRKKKRLEQSCEPGTPGDDSPEATVEKPTGAPDTDPPESGGEAD
ncbi:MAG: hypothetical protein IKY07_06725, partial [Clostridia bacterium]|nr:hypothetical protein [Clostridia bacterium]